MGDVFSLEVHGIAKTQPFVNVLHFEIAGPVTNIMTSLTNLIAGFQADVEAAYVDCMSDDAQIVGYKARRVTAPGSPAMSLPVTSVLGTVSSEINTAATGPVILGYYTHSGKTRAGRIFLSGTPESFVAGNALTAGAITAVNALITALQGGVSNGGESFSFVIFSKKYSIPIGPFLFEVSGKVGVQRRRLLPVF